MIMAHIFSQQAYQMFQFSFEDYSPAVLIRNLTQSTILPYADQSRAFSSDQLRLLLVEAFHWAEFDFMAIINILEFGKDKYKRITLDELTDYVMEKYLGEITIVKFMKQRGYARRDEHIMNKQEFLETLALGLNFLPAFNISQFKHIFGPIFESLDKRNVGTIPHTHYCSFLKHYLGSESPMAINPTKRVAQLSESRELSYQSPQRQSQENEQSLRQMIDKESSSSSNNFSSSNREIPQRQVCSENYRSALDNFHDLIVTSIIEKCRIYDTDQDERLFRNECQSFLYDVLELQGNSIAFIIENYFNFRTANTVPFGSMVEIVCEIHFRQIFTNIIKNEHQGENPSKILMQRGYFTQKLMQNCYFFPTQPTLVLLEAVFDQLLHKSGNITSGKLTLDEFRSFVLVRCCNNKLIFRQQAKKSTHTLANPPASIMQAENSHYQQDQSQGSSVRPSRKQFISTHKSASKDRDIDSRERSIEEIGLSSNKRTKINKLSEESINFHNQLMPSSYPLTSKEVNVSSSSIKLVSQPENIQYMYGQRSKPLKEILWNRIEVISLKYAVSQKGMLKRQQIEAMFNSEDIFSQDSALFKSRTSKMFAKRVSIQIQTIISFIIHLKGEQALIHFSGKQIKGKSTLNQAEISSILNNAYGKITQTSTAFFQDFSKNLFIQNGKSLFQYKNYLELIARNLSIKHNF